MAEGEFALVRQHMELALKKSASPADAPSGDHDLYAMLADAAAQQHDALALSHYAPLAEETATRIQHAFYTAIAHRAWGVGHRLAGEYAEGERRLNLALNTFAEMGTRWQSGITLFELGELKRAQRNTAAARDYFSRALIAFEAMRAIPDAARVRAALQEMADGEGLQAAIPSPKYPAGLTEREVEVLRWLARGLSNQEIADKLVLSKRTVHAHLRSIYGKLDVTTRSAATRIAIENKIV